MSMEFLVAVTVLLVSFFLYLRQKSSSSLKKLPPGPFPLPIIGNFHQLSGTPYVTLTNLSKTYGPLMRLKLGTQETVVVSSSEMAKEILMKHDKVTSGRVPPFITGALDHDAYSMATLPVNDKWRILRRVCREHIFTPQKMQETEGIRQEKLRKMREYLADCSGSGVVVDIGEAVMVTNLNLLSNTIFSVDFATFGTKGTQEIRQAIYACTSTAGQSNPADYFPVLKRFDPKGLKKKLTVAYTKLMRILEDIVGNRMEERRMPTYSKKSDLLEVLLDLNQENGDEFSMTDVYHLLLDLIVAGGDSTSLFIQWVMSELLRDPKKMSRAQNELRAVVGDHKEKQAVESQISDLPYLNAVIKETFRCKPGAPFLAPHKAEADVEINGYTIPKGTAILVNVWAISRDPTVWPDPNSFQPERFLKTNTDYRGQSFELLPFGSGRRICPGMPLVHLVVHLLVAHMIHSFDWKIDGVSRPQDVDVSEKGEFFIHMTTPLKAIPVMKK